MTRTSNAGKAGTVGINHVALEVDDIDAALEFYGGIFEITLRGRTQHMAFIDMGDQFIALSDERTQAPDTERHFGLVVDDREAVRRALEDMNVDILPGRGLDFLDPSGNRVQIVEYGDVQFMKTPQVLRAMGIGSLDKSEDAMRQLADKGMTPE